MILCRETFKKSIQAVSDSPYALTGEDGKKWDWSWAQALEILRVWEYTGRIRRGYFVEGMSGAQFVRSEDYAIYPEQKRLVLKEYPAEAAEALQHAGYMREMKDYVVYK